MGNAHPYETHFPVGQKHKTPQKDWLLNIYFFPLAALSPLLSIS
jgi:hypothetical protein